MKLTRTFALALALLVASVLSLEAEEIEHRLGLVRSFVPDVAMSFVQDRALERIATGVGLPYTFVDDPAALDGFPVVVLAAGPGNSDLTPAWREALYAYVENGGVLVSPAIVGSDLYPLFGINSVSSRRDRTRLTFSGDDPALAYIDHPREQTISLGNGEFVVYDEVAWSHGADIDPFATPLGRFPDDTVGFSVNYYGSGIAYYLGLSFVETVLLPQAGGDYEAQREFVNAVEPSADVIMLLVKAIYEEHAELPVYIGIVPQGRPTALILSHDVDAQDSFVDSLKFARLEQEFGTTSTFFETTKYFIDNADIAYYSAPGNLEAIRELVRMGFDIGSHTVTHSYEFDDAVPGSPDVTFETYRPLETLTVNGEVRVSKQLLDRDLPGQDTITFRSGYLAFPTELIGVLEDAGYRYDSSFSANDVLTTFPYFALRERRVDAEVSSVVEIPVTFDDALGFLSPDRVDEAVAVWTDVIRAHANNETISVLLIHPSDTGERDYKLRAQRAAMEYARDLGAWIGNLTEYGEFWRSRSRLRIARVERAAEVVRLHIDAGSGEVHPWTTIVIGDPGTSVTFELVAADGADLEFSTQKRDGKLFLSDLR
ncbi:MAG: polysaccharide deacetylase family protein [Spirochaeta sp.]|jgi:peptidoglycan/xylan/chitin deacetylase (PgdA/CDA1 family)|nr:polysaccharide deacetylase family protein [Spirochaeta sp.]